MDDIDMKIVRTVLQDGRISITELADRVSMSAPAVTERLRRLEQRGVIQHYQAVVNPEKLGYHLEAIVRLKPRPGALKKVEEMIVQQPRFTQCDKVTGDDCFIARLALRSIAELDVLLDPFHDLAETNTAIVKSSPVRMRLPVL